MARQSSQEMAAELAALYERMWWVIALLDERELDEGVMEDGHSPKVLLGQIAAWNVVHVRRMYKVAVPELVSFVESLNGGLLEEADLARLRDREPQRIAVEVNLPLEAVLEELERSEEWSLAMIRGEESKLARYIDGEPDERVHAVFQGLTQEFRDCVRRLRRWAGSMRRWKQEELLRFLDHQHELLMESIAGLDEATILGTITHEPWSMRDELVHLLAWNEFALHIVDNWPTPDEAGVRQFIATETVDEDQVNDVLLAERAGLNMIDVVDGLATVHRRTMKRLEAQGAEGLANEGDWLFNTRGDLSGFVYAMAIHQAEHCEWLWKTRLALGR